MKRAVLLFSVLVGCGTEAPIMPKEGETLFPLALGNRWTYRVRDANGEETKIQTVTATGADGRFQLTTESGNDRTVSENRLDGSQLSRLSEESYEDGVLRERIEFLPPQLRLDVAETRLGTTYANAFTEIHFDGSGVETGRTTKTQRFAIEAVDEAVVVPAGEIRAVRVRRETQGGAAKTFWYARGVGKIREVGGQLEELVSSEVANEESAP